MITPTNDRQTSERERLAERLSLLTLHQSLSGPVDALCNEAAAQLRADERLDAEIAALRAENEALRTVTDSDAYEAAKSYRSFMGDLWELPAPGGMLHAIQSFIRSKESRRG